MEVESDGGGGRCEVQTMEVETMEVDKKELETMKVDDGGGRMTLEE